MARRALPTRRVPALSSPQQVLVVGAGAIGLLSALALHRSGVRVTLVERGTAGRESSWAGGGILSPILPWDYPAPIWALSRRSLELYPALCAGLAATTGIDPELTASGALLLDPPAPARVLDWCAGEQRAALPWNGRLHAGGEARTGFALPWIGQLRNPRLCQALRAEVRRLDIALHENEAVLDWVRRGERVVGLRTTVAERRADAVVLAAGAWSGGLLPGLPVTPVRGQMLLLRSAPGTLAPIVFERGRYLIPRRDGRILAGSTVERAGFDKGVTAAVHDELLAFARGLLGAAVDGAVEAHWAGLRPGSGDELPFIGEHPQHPGLFLNAGHYRNGLVMGAASAELLADLLLGRAPAVDPVPYRPTAGRLNAAG